MIIGFGAIPRMYQVAAASIGWANAFTGEANTITIGSGHLDWTGQAFEISGVESTYFHPTFDSSYGLIDKVARLFGRDPRPPAGRLTRR